MKELLTCCICDETLNEPKTLGCFHSFCKKCLGEYVESQRKKAEKVYQHVFNCPLCGTQFQLKQEESVDQIGTCFFINNLLEMLNILNQASEQACESCKSKVPVVSRCIECENYLCEKCLTVHKNWPAFSKHELLSLEELRKPENQSKGKAKSRCTKTGHGKKQLDFFCSTCDELACLTCVLLDHLKPKHSCQPIDLAANFQKETLKTTSGNLQRKSDAVHDTLKKIKEASENMKDSIKKTKDDILRQKKEILEAFTKKLENTTQALIVEVDREHHEVNQKLSKQHDDMKVYAEKVNGSLEFAKNIIEKGSNEDILSLGNEIMQNAIDIDIECPKMMRPIHSGYFEYQQIKSAPENIADELNLQELGKVGKFVFLVFEN